MVKSSAAIARRKTAGVRHASGFQSLTPDEAATLLGLQWESHSLRTGQEIVSEGRRCATIFMITEGLAIRYRILRDGQRQIIDLLLPGDFAGLRSCFFESAPFSIKTVTKSVIARVPFARIVELFENQPRLAAKLFCSLSCETLISTEHLVAVGRRPALERVAHFLMELLTRLQRVGMADGQSFRLPLTQEVIGDVLGLSKPYVNRVLHELSDSGLVSITEKVVVIENVEELAALADFKQTYLEPRSFSELLAENA